MLFSYGCATFTHRGISVYDRQKDTYMTTSEMEKAIDYALDKLKNEKMYDGWDLVFMSGYYGVMTPDGKIIVADGATFHNKRVIFIKVYKCYGDSALIHEMAHVIVGDMLHRQKLFWEKIDEMGEKMAKDLCPKEYKTQKKLKRM